MVAKKDILLVNNYSGGYGAEVMLCHLFDALSVAYRVRTVLNPSVEVPQRYASRLEAEMHKFNVIAKKRARFSLKSLAFWWKLLGDARPALVVVNISLIPEIIVAAKLRRISCVVFVRESLVDSPTLFSMYKVFLRWGATELVCNSKYTESMFGFPVKRLPDCVAVLDGSDSEAGARRTKGRKLPGDRITLCYVGRLSPRKGCALIVDALSQKGLAKRFHVVFVGDCKEEDVAYFDRLRGSLGEIPGASFEFVGFQERPSDYVRESDFAIAPSVLPETFGLVVLEALAVGVPVIGSAVGAYPELIEEGVNGYLFEPGDASELASVLARIASLPKESFLRMRRAAADSSKRFRVEFYKVQALEIVSDVISGHRQSRA